MSYSDLSLNYYYDENGEYDEFLGICQQCIMANIYLILKHRMKCQFDPYNLFMEDTTPLLIVDKEKKDLRVVNLLPHEPKFLKKINVNTTVRDYEPNAVKILEELLEQGYMVMVQTAFHMLPNWVIYRPEYVYESDDNFDRNAQHAIIALWHDKDYFYFNDKQDSVYSDKIELVEKEVYRVKKEELAFPLGKFLKFTTFDVDEDKINSLGLNYDLLKQIVENYDKHFIQVSDVTLRFSGRDALTQLIKICENQELYPKFELVYGAFEPDLFKYIIFRKVMLHRWLVRNSQEDSLCRRAFDVVNAWSIAKNSAIKNIIRKNKVPGIEPCLKKCFENILEKEDAFIAGLKTHLKC
ncbi:MAG: hypothetical protein K0R50_2656 [Eubacterium sp.]|nr:hypothetical protein [Eubacterium sp.]